MKILITGASGFFGEILKKFLLAQGHHIVNIDLEEDFVSHPHLTSFTANICDPSIDEHIFEKHRFDAIIHCAAILAHAVKDEAFLWRSNVDGTRHIAALAKKHQVKKIVFISSNCLWATNFGRPVSEADTPAPVEIYGRSKWEGEKILLEYRDHMDVVILRSPTIMDSGRLGLLGILFQFIDEGRKVWVVGGGRNRYQFIYAMDLADACLRAIDYRGSDIFNVGSDNVKTFREVYDYVIARANTKARVVSLPRAPALLGMRLAHALHLSPLGPYQYRMIAEDFVFDTRKIKHKLRWMPTLTNEEMLLKAYEYYRDHASEIQTRKNVSAHKQMASMGIIRLLKWLS